MKIFLYFIFNRRFQPFPVGVHLQDQRRLFGPNQDLFRTVEKIKKFQPEVELLPVLYMIYSKIFCISVFNLNLRPFPVGVRLRDQRRLFAPRQGLFRTVKKIKKLQPEVQLFPVLYKIYLKIIRISVFNLNLRPFLVGARVWCLRTVFAPVYALFRTVEKIEKFQPEVELLPVLYKICSKIFRIFVFNLNLRPFLVGVRL